MISDSMTAFPSFWHHMIWRTHTAKFVVLSSQLCRSPINNTALANLLHILVKMNIKHFMKAFCQKFSVLDDFDVLHAQAPPHAVPQHLAERSGTAAAKVAMHAASQSLLEACAFLSRLAGAEIEL